MCEERYLTFYSVEQVSLALLLPHVNELVVDAPLGLQIPAGEYLFPILLLDWVPHEINAHGKCKDNRHCWCS